MKHKEISLHYETNNELLHFIEKFNKNFPPEDIFITANGKTVSVFLNEINFRKFENICSME